MKKTKNFIHSLILMGTPLLAATIISTPTYAQYNNNNSTWEFVGTTTAIGNISSINGQLYVKAIGDRLIYKFIYAGTEYSVSKVNNVRGYNAQIIFFDRVYYLNVPDW